MSSSGVEGGEVGAECSVELAGDLALEAADDLLFGAPFGKSALHVGLDVIAISESDDDDHVKGSVGLAVAGVVEAVSAGSP